MNQALAHLWAKTSKDGQDRWHPLILHMLDVSATADAILAREPQVTRERMAAILGLNWEAARPWLLFVVACHDLGKACPGFQCKWRSMVELQLPRSPNTDINHAFVSQIELSSWLQGQGWHAELADLVADAVGCHHGERAAPTILDPLMGDRRAMGSAAWGEARRELIEALMEVLDPTITPTKGSLSGPDFMLLYGLTSFADWIGSNEDWFKFGNSDNCRDLKGWFQDRRACADRALHGIGWEPRTPLAQETKSFTNVFGFAPRPLQQAVEEALTEVKTPRDSAAGSTHG